MFHELAGRTDTESQGDYNYIDGDGDGDGEAMMISPHLRSFQVLLWHYCTLIY